MNPIEPLLARALLFAGFSTLAADPANPRVVDLCLDLKRPLQMCRCSAGKLVQRASDKDFKDYASVSETYLQNKRSGLRRRVAWANAVTALASQSGEAPDTVSDRLDTIAGQHRMAMQECSRL